MPASAEVKLERGAAEDQEFDDAEIVNLLHASGSLLRILSGFNKRKYRKEVWRVRNRNEDIGWIKFSPFVPVKKVLNDEAGLVTVRCEPSWLAGQPAAYL
jgi:hypothetical protein